MTSAVMPTTPVGVPLEYASGKVPVAPALRMHVPALDGIRGLAVLLVTLHHLVNGLSHSNFFATVFFRIAACGYMGVDLFFVLSGFLITGILCDAKGSKHYFRNFYVRRTLRIFPLYYGVLAVAFILPIILGHGATDDSRQWWLWAYVSNTYSLFHPNAWFEVVNRWNLSFGNFWSLAVEEHFYLLWPFLIFALPRKHAMTACWIFIVGSLLLRTGFVAAGFGGMSVPYVFTLCRLDGLAMGSLVALLARGPGGLSSLIQPARWLFWLLIPVLVAGISWNALDRTSPIIATAGFTLLPLFFTCVLISVVMSAKTGLLNGFFSSASMRFFGRYSYGMYVFQGLFIDYFNNGPLSVPNLLKSNGHYFLNVLLHAGVMLIVITAMAVVSYHAYEKWFLKLKSWFAYSHRSEGSVKHA